MIDPALSIELGQRVIDELRTSDELDELLDRVMSWPEDRLPSIWGR